MTAPSFVLDLPADYRIEETLKFHGRDPEGLTEVIEGRRMRRAVLLEGRPSILALEFNRRRVRCLVESKAPPGPEGMAEARHVVWRLLGLGIDPGEFERRLARRPALRRLVEARRGLRIPQTADVFEGLTWAIVGQQVNLPFAYRLRRQVIDLAGRRAAGGLRAHPSARAIARLDYADLTRRQFSRRKAEYLIEAARLVATGELPAEELPGLPAAEVEERLMAVRGLGPWSTQYIMMRSCGFADCVPVGDSGLVTALQKFFELEERPGPDETRRLMRPFAPYRSLATNHLWRTLGDPK